jgi:hypothetical protein
MSCPVKPIPEEFEKVIEDFVNDMKLSFPEYNIFICKWWKSRENFSDEVMFREHQDKRMRFIFQYCLKKYPPHFFDILHKNNELFSEDSTANTEFLPQIHFRNPPHISIKIRPYLQPLAITSHHTANLPKQHRTHHLTLRTARSAQRNPRL